MDERRENGGRIERVCHAFIRKEGIVVIWIVFLQSLQAKLKNMRLYLRLIFASAQSFSPTKIKHIAIVMILNQALRAPGGSWKSPVVPFNG